MHCLSKLRFCLVLGFLVILPFSSAQVFADPQDQLQTTPDQSDLAAIRKHLVIIKKELAQIRDLQDKLEQEVDVVKIRIRRAGKGSS